MTIKVITYGTYDLLHEGHIKLLERAKALGDYLIVAVTSDDFDKARGKINVVQPLDVRMENVRKTGLADRIIVEEYEGQKIDDIIKYDVDIFTLGSDWKGKFDYLDKYCKVIYLDRTPNISSTLLRSKSRIKIGFLGDFTPISKYIRECAYINGFDITGIVSKDSNVINYANSTKITKYNHYSELLDNVDAIVIVSDPHLHYEQIKEALNKNKHVLCHSPICLNKKQYDELINLAHCKRLILMDAIKTAYSTAYSRMRLLLEGGAIGDIVSVQSTCTSIREERYEGWNSLCMWGPVALLPAFTILGPNPEEIHIISKMNDLNEDSFTSINLRYPTAIANIMVGDGVKSENNLVITGTKGYVYVPSPWWNLDYFEIRYEDISKNKRYFYELMGEGIRQMFSSFFKNIMSETNPDNTEYPRSIVNVMELFENNNIVRLGDLDD